MSKQAITNYYNTIDKLKRFGGSRNENSTRRAFANLLQEYCNSKNLMLVDELRLKNSTRIPDGTIKNNSRLDWGHWESKDEKDILDNEIDEKFTIGYPKYNILFENSKEIILIQKAKEVMRGSMQDADFLHRILIEFTSYQPPIITNFQIAIEKFKEDVPDVLETLRAMIAEQAETNPKFKQARADFWKMCKESINPEISSFDIREMLIQHILTHEIFTTIFDDADFHKHNNIAKQLQTVIDTFFTRAIKKNTFAKIDTYYKTIKNAASGINDHHEKQKFLKVIYENFYKAYNPKGADKLGIVYTPNEIVKFMIESTDYLLDKYFGKQLQDKNVEILDPATGTGTYITDIIEHIPKQYLEYKYKNEIHCNELAILPYYIANLNIEYTYMQKMSRYEPFENIVFVDTLDNLGFSYKEKQTSLQGYGFSEENMERIIKQNKKKISVIIGNPPYNANQMSENDNNKNREYYKNITRKEGGVDGRIKDTYIKYSTAQKSKVYDMYSRFYRWASDRINKDGIIAFITNRSFIDSRTFDGFRKSVENEFDYIYIIDLKGDIRAITDRTLKTGNVFDIMTGVAIAFFVKNSKKENKSCRISYSFVSDEFNKAEKLEFISSNKLKDIEFDKIEPDKNNNWLNIADNDFKTFIPLIKRNNENNSIFNFHTNGVATNRDEWVTDINKKNLKNKIKYFIKIYNQDVKKLHKKKNIKEINNLINYSIKWSRDLKNKLLRNKKIKYSNNNLKKSYYRPFTKKEFYTDYFLNDVLTQNHYEVFGENLDKKNKIISFLGNDTTTSFTILSTNIIQDLNSLSPASGGTKCVPFYQNDKTNITDWGLEKFREHYELKNILIKTKKKIDNDYVKHRFLLEEPLFKITKEDIFHYTYGVLHNPVYRKKYELNLKREFPRLPFYKYFYKWVNWGKTLMDLHINYETVKPYPAVKTLHATSPKENPKAKLRRDKTTNEITLDENTTIKGIPAIAFDYKLGNRSAIEWILDQHKEKKPRDKTIREKFNTYKFADYKDKVIDLIQRVTTVSVKTMEIVNQMSKEEGHEK